MCLCDAELLGDAGMVDLPSDEDSDSDEEELDEDSVLLYGKWPWTLFTKVNAICCAQTFLIIPDGLLYKSHPFARVQSLAYQHNSKIMNEAGDLRG